MMIITDLDILKQISKDTTPLECQERKLFKALEEALQASSIPGVGLASIQIGIALRAVILRYGNLQLNMINPVILEEYDKVKVFGEGCLSLPGVKIDTQRYSEVFCEWIDAETGKTRQAAFFKEEALLVQHEVHHTQGILITDREWVAPCKIGRNELCPFCLERGIKIKWKKCREHNNG